MKILLTGGAGYIGSHVLLSILEKRYEAVVVDDLSTGHESLVPRSRSSSSKSTVAAAR